MPTIKEGEVIEEFRTRDEDLDTRINDYPSYCDDDKKIHIDCAHNLKFSCMIEFEFTHANFFPLLYVNVMSKKFHNSIMKDKMMYKGNNVVGALMNVPIFVGTFSIMTDFAVLKNMDTYRDEGMGDLEICTLQMGMYLSSQNSSDFTTVTIIGETEERRTTKGIIQNYYDREDGETTPRFEV
ncbi:hypothetical protein Tco_0266977 [Tanacetum coccineum]